MRCIQIDLLKQYGPLPFELNFFTDMLNLSPLLRYLEGRIVPIEELEQQEKHRYESARESKRANDDDEEDEGEEEVARPPEVRSGRSLLQDKYKALTAAFCEVVDDYSLVSFLPLNIEDAEVLKVYFSFLL